MSITTEVGNSRNLVGQTGEAPVVEGSPALWFGACGFELVVSVQTTAMIVGCSSCGRKATPKDRRWVTIRDAPSGDRAVRLR